MFGFDCWVERQMRTFGTSVLVLEIFVILFGRIQLYRFQCSLFSQNNPFNGVEEEPDRKEEVEAAL
jgi:hypothetical protein